MPDVLLEELLGRQEVVLVVLLEDAEPGGIRQRLEMDGRRVDLRGDVGELDLAHARGQAHLARVLHQPEVAVVDRDHQVPLALARDRERGRGGGRASRGQGGEGEQHQGDGTAHGWLLLGLVESDARSLGPAAGEKVPGRKCRGRTRSGLDGDGDLDADLEAEASSARARSSTGRCAPDPRPARGSARPGRRRR